MRIKTEIPAWVRGASPALVLFLLIKTTGAQGVVYMTPSQPVYYGGGPVTRNIDITESGNPDFLLYCDGVLGSFMYPGNNKLVVVPQTGDLDTGSLIAALNPGDVIGSNPSSLNPVFQWRSSADEPNGAPTLADQNTAGQIGNFFGKTAYIGFDLVQNGQNYYGWMEVQNPLSFAAGSIVEWGYSTSPNTAIFAGGGMVPEPSTTALLISSGCLIWLLQKRFRS